MWAICPLPAVRRALKLFLPNIGTPISVNLIMDRVTGRPRGFGFVEMEDNDARNAIAALNGTDFEGRTLRVNEAEKRPAPRRW